MDPETNNLNAVKLSYRPLMNRYLFLLRYFAAGNAGWLDRQIVEDHIRVRILAIKNAFTLREHNASNSGDREDYTWLKRELDYLSRLVDQLANFGWFRDQAVRFAWRGLGLLFALTTYKLTDVTDAVLNTDYALRNLGTIIQGLLLSFGALFLIGSFILMLIAAFLTNQKRHYLKPGYDEYDQRREGFSESGEDENVYQLENELFDKLAMQKPKDAPWDIWAMIFICIVFCVLIVALFIDISSGAPNQFVAWALPAGLILGLSFVMWMEIKNRLKRDR